MLEKYLAVRNPYLRRQKDRMNITEKLVQVLVPVLRQSFWSLSSGEQPDDLMLLVSGTVSGTLTTLGIFTFTVKAENIAGENTKELSITEQQYCRSLPPPRYQMA